MRFEAVLAVHPREVTALLALAGVLADAGDFDRAVELAAAAEWLGASDALETRLRIQERRDASGASPASG